MFKRVLLFALLMIGGCADQVVDCSNVIEDAASAGRAGQSLDAELPEVCRAEAEQAWQDELVESCQPQTGFDRGYQGQPQLQACTQENHQSAHRLGQLLFELEAEKAELEQQIADHPTEQRDDAAALTAMRNRLIVIERDLPEVETLARLEGFLPPAAVPDGTAADETL